jgi:hypothetical protein
VTVIVFDGGDVNDRAVVGTETNCAHVVIETVCRWDGNDGVTVVAGIGCVMIVTATIVRRRGLEL